MILHHLSIGYHHSAPILTDIDAELCCGRLVALIGRNGSGKSTLLQTMARLLPPLTGCIEGETPAIVLTATPDLRHTTVLQMVAYGRLPHTGFFGKLHDQDYQIARQAIETLGIVALQDRLFCRLSDGEKQKVMIARALAQGTSTLLLDEPSAFLDYPSRVQLMQNLQSLAHTQHKAILISTHDLDLARQYADTFWWIHDRQLTTNVDPQSEKFTTWF